jgi:hypothetical protein
MSVVRRSDIENLQIPVPSLAVQRTIVALDNLMREEQSLLQELARKKHAFISTVCMATAERRVEQEGTEGTEVREAEAECIGCLKGHHR